MSKTWRVGLIGCGVVGSWHGRIYTQMPNVQLVAICDVKPEKAHQFIEKHGLQDRGIKVYADQAEMHRNEQLDFVTVCTPSGNHLEPAVQAMQAGVNVICEKPLEINLERIDQMLATAKKCKVKLAGIFQNRWNPANRALYEAARANRFGRLAWAGCFTPWYRSDEYYREGGWRGTWRLDGGGAIMNQSVHSVDLIQWIVGPVKEVAAYASSRIHAEIEVEDTLSATLTFENGAYGSILGSTAMWPGVDVRVELGGESGTARSEGGLKVWAFKDATDADKAYVEQVNAARPVSAGAGQVDQGLELHWANIAHILESWEAGKEPETAGPEARKAVAIIMALYESARKGGKPVKVKQKPTRAKKTPAPEAAPARNQ
jgi:UDP-N-acetyl-2-amino-2-deoxyglucuronate dehydrogenase